MIIELTHERQQIISEGRAKWLAAGLSTEPADFDRAEAAITRLYQRIGKKKPYFVRLSSPSPPIIKDRDNARPIFRRSATNFGRG